MSLFSSILGALGSLFGSIDGIFRAIRNGVRSAWQSLMDGPLSSFIVALVIGLTGLRILFETVFGWIDRVVGWAERGMVMLAMLLMTFLAFNEYLRREVQTYFGPQETGLWSLDGQMNVALLLMVVVGFVGASLATQEKNHIAVDAVDKALTARPARLVKRLVGLVSALLCFAFMNGSYHSVYANSQGAFEGAKVWSFLVAPVNWVTALMPGDKFGPGTEFEDVMSWEDAQFDAGVEWDALPPAFGYVEAGDRFPLWIPLAAITIIFGVMGLRFLGHVLYPPVPDEPAWSPPGASSGGSGGSKKGGVADLLLAGLFPGALLAMACGACMGQGTLIVAASVMLVFLGAPLFVAVGVGTVAAWMLLRDGSTETVISDMFEATKKQELLAIPFFVLAGNLMTKGSIASRLIDVARNSIGFLPGGLGAGAVIACAFFAAISGSSPVTVIAIGSILFPMLVAEGYSERYSMGVLTTAGGLGIIIPPSIPMIIYAIIVSGNPKIGAIDPAVLFKAGILPGLFIAVVLIGYTMFLWWPRPGEGDEYFEGAREPSEYGRDLAWSLVRGAPSLMLPVIILGGIYGVFDLNFIGIDFSISFTVTEAAAVAVVYALFVELVIHRELEYRKIPGVFSESAIMMGSLFLILVIAISLNRFFVFEQVPEAATELMLSYVDSKLTFLIMVNLFLLGLGCVMDIISAILIVAPLLAPIAHEYGIHPIHFGIMFIVNLELGYLTPPLGINLFVASTVFERSLLDVIRAVVPFLLLMLFCLVVIVWFPSLSLYLVE